MKLIKYRLECGFFTVIKPLYWDEKHLHLVEILLHWDEKQILYDNILSVIG